MVGMVFKANICIVRIKKKFVICLNGGLLYIELLLIGLVDGINELEWISYFYIITRICKRNLLAILLTCKKIFFKFWLHFFVFLFLIQGVLDFYEGNLIILFLLLDFNLRRTIHIERKWLLEALALNRMIRSCGFDLFGHWRFFDFGNIEGLWSFSLFYLIHFHRAIFLLEGLGIIILDFEIVWRYFWANWNSIGKIPKKWIRF